MAKIVKILFDRAKWVKDKNKSNVKNYIGKVTVKDCTVNVSILHSDGSLGPFNDPTKLPAGSKIIGQIDIDGSTYVLFNDMNLGHGAPRWCELYDTLGREYELKNGGVLSNLYIPSFCHIFATRKEKYMAIKKMLFNSKTWLPQAPGKWYKCAGHSIWGYVWLWKFNSKTNIMETVKKPDGPDGIDTLGKGTLVKLTDIEQFTAGVNTAQTGGTLQEYRKIVECSARPDCVGEYVTSSDVIPVNQNGGVLRRLYIKLCGAFRKQVVVC